MNYDGIKRAAFQYIRDYRTNASRVARRNIKYLRSAGDEPGARDWERVDADIQRQTRKLFHSRWDADDRNS
jgi:hypothetical protein